MQIPRIDLHAQYEAIKYEVATAFEEVLENMQLFLGPQLQALEKVFAAYCGCHYGVGLSSCTDALTLAFRSCGTGPGDEVITVANAFIATVGAITLVGAKSIFVDVDQDTYSMDWRQLDQVFTPCTRALQKSGAYGEAGICVTSDHALAENLCMLRDHGSRLRYRHELLVVNARLY